MWIEVNPTTSKQDLNVFQIEFRSSAQVLRFCYFAPNWFRICFQIELDFFPKIFHVMKSLCAWEIIMVKVPLSTYVLWCRNRASACVDIVPSQLLKFFSFFELFSFGLCVNKQYIWLGSLVWKAITKLIHFERKITIKEIWQTSSNERALYTALIYVSIKYIFV